LNPELNVTYSSLNILDHFTYKSNTGGLGGAFGYFYGVGKPLPIREARPYKPSFRFRALQLIGALAKKIGGKKD